MACKKLIAAVLLCVYFVAPIVVHADPTDTGQITVTATIPPASSTYTTQISVAPTTTLKQAEEFTYTIDFDSTYVSAYDVTVEATWTQGTIDGAVTPTVDVVEYVLGSASTGYGGAVAVVDTQNRTIQWNISSFPAQSSGQLTFKLRTTSNYTGSNTVTFDATSQITAPVTTGVSTVMSTYQYVVPPTPTPTPTTSTSSSGTPTPTPTPTSTVTPTPTVTLPVVTAVGFTNIGATSAEIVVTTRDPARLTIKYGTHISGLNRTLTLLEASKNHTFVLTDLLPNTRYYFQIFDAQTNQRLLTDVFTFITAESTEGLPVIKPTALIVTQKGNLMYNGGIIADTGVAPPLIVTTNSIIDLYVTIPENDAVESVDVFIRQWKVLGATTDSQDQFQSSNTRLTQTTNDTYVGKVRSPAEPGEYELVSRIKDVYGNYHEFPIVKMHVISNLIITDGTGAPLEHAKIILSLYNHATGLYEPISQTTTSMKTPTYSDENGIVFLNIGPGKYKAAISLLGYRTQEIEFEVSMHGAYSLPAVSLLPVINFWPALKLAQALTAVVSVILVLTLPMQNLATSNNFYVLMLLGTCLLCVLSGLVGLFLKFHPHFNSEELLTYHRQFVTTRILSWIAYYCIQFTIFIAEFFLFFACIFSLLFIASFSIEKTLPFVCVVVVCLSLWIVDSIVYVRGKNTARKHS